MIDSEKEFIRTILKYEEQAKSLADALNKSRFFERKGIGLVQLGGKNILFINKEIYDDYFQNNGLMYFEELLSLLDKLIERRSERIKYTLNSLCIPKNSLILRPTLINKK